MTDTTYMSKAATTTTTGVTMNRISETWKCMFGIWGMSFKDAWAFTGEDR